MPKQLPLQTLILLLLSVGILSAQSRSGNVLSSFGDGNGDRFGATVSISNDGTRLAVMAPDNGLSGSDNPQAEVYELQGGSWVRLGATFSDYASSPLEEEATITISGNGTTVATGEPAYNTVQHSSAGRIVTSRFSSGSWSTIANMRYGDYQDARAGEKVLLINNGTQMMTANFGGNADDPRGAYNLIRTTTWDSVGTQPILQSSNEVSITGIALSEQGLEIAIGLDKGPNAPGEVQLFQFPAVDWVGSGSYVGSVNGDGFGESIAMANNGNTVAIGAPYDGSGKVRVYGSGSTQIGSTLSGGVSDQAFGYSIDISEDGNTIAIGAPANDPSNEGLGRVYVYNFVNGDWALANTFTGSTIGEQTGQSVSLSNDGMHLAIGRPGYGLQGTDNDAGEVDVFLLDGSTSTQDATVLNIQAFPNPTSSVLHISGLPAGESRIVVRDAIGRLFMTAEDVRDVIDVTDLQAGYYFLEVQHLKGTGRIPFIKK